MKKNNHALFFTCSLIEYISRVTKNERNQVVKSLGEDLKRIYSYADVFHCEPIAKMADDFIERKSIQNGKYDNISKCRYSVPDYWDIVEVFARLIEDCYEENKVIHEIREVYASWLAERILNFNSDLYYQSRDYIAACFKEETLLLTQVKETSHTCL